MFTSGGFVQCEELTKHKKLKMNRKNLTMSTQHRILTAGRFLDDVTQQIEIQFSQVSFCSDLADKKVGSFGFVLVLDAIITRQVVLKVC